MNAASGKPLEHGNFRRQGRRWMLPSPSKTNDHKNQDQNAYRFVQPIKRTHLEIGDQQSGRNLKQHQYGCEPMKQSGG
jgi:hypothetical protein